MARGRFVAAFYSNCANCEEVIEPGDDAGFAHGVDGAVCMECLDELDELEGDVESSFDDWRR